MQRLFAVALALLAAAPGRSAERFSGSAALQPLATQTSANHRFALSAELQSTAVAKTTADGRFSLIADLAAPKSLATACGPVVDAIFNNGFENYFAAHTKEAAHETHPALTRPYCRHQLRQRCAVDLSWHP